MAAVQPELFLVPNHMPDALLHFAGSSPESRGAIHTRREVAEFTLDLAGWQTGGDLTSMRLLEPSAGHGDFLEPAVKRLLADKKSCGIDKLENCIRAVEVDEKSLFICRERLEPIIRANGFDDKKTQHLLNAWLIHADFLTFQLPSHFTHIVGNPPYIRLEALPKDLLRLYRSLWRSLFDRADLYVAFIEKSLTLLAPEGKLGFICADRWMKNRYGGPLREIIASQFHLDTYVDFTNCPAFHDEVSAYPAVTIIRRGIGTKTRTAFRPEISSTSLNELARGLSGIVKHPNVKTFNSIIKGNRPWIFDNDGSLEIIRRLENTLPTLEEAQCRVGIGVATGADAIFIGREEDLDVEPERKLPLVTTKDIQSGSISWKGLWVLNPFNDNGSLINLNDYPRFKKYVEHHRTVIEKRNVAERNPKGWFRTIDRIHSQLTATPKLLIPDIKGTAHVVFESGQYYPHHNLYFVTSRHWSLDALRIVLRSRVAFAFIAAYCPRMRGDFLRFQAQYLRRIRLPLWTKVDVNLRRKLTEAAANEDSALADEAVQELYKFNKSDWVTLAKPS